MPVAFISGVLKEKKPAAAIVEAGGIGYYVMIPTSTYARLPRDNESVVLLTYLHVREEALQLFGFSSESERLLFRLMIGVTGVGPKLALAALSAMNPNEFCRHILSRDSQTLTRIPGVGRKTADRLVLELHDRVASLPADDMQPTRSQQAREDALAALETLGLTRAAAERRMRVVERKHPEVRESSELIRLALRE